MCCVDHRCEINHSHRYYNSKSNNKNITRVRNAVVDKKETKLIHATKKKRKMSVNIKK